MAVRMEENKKRNTIDLQELLKITKFTKQEIKMMYRGFKQAKPQKILIEKKLQYNTHRSAQMVR